LISFPHFKTLFNAGNADLSLARALDHSPSADHSHVEKALTRSLQHLTKAILLEPSNIDALRNGAVPLVSNILLSDPFLTTPLLRLLRLC
jgi:cellobiose-specific phosphotransferase system component IIA